MIQTDHPQVRVQELMRAGRIALGKGDRQRAHHLWRQAATLDPQNEHIWVSLLNVVENNNDRCVCLQNIVAINPSNTQAWQQLEKYAHALQDIHPTMQLRKRWISQRFTAFSGMIRMAKLIAVMLITIVLFALGIIAGLVFNLL